jgi:hypothetical protein
MANCLNGCVNDLAFKSQLPIQTKSRAVGKQRHVQMGSIRVKQAGLQQVCAVCIFRHASAPEIAYVHSKSTDAVAEGPYE